MNKLNFVQHPSFKEARHARIFFPNGYGASVVSGPMFYTDEEHPYQLAVLEGTEEESLLTYDTPVASDVVGYLTYDQVLATLEAIEELPSG